MSEDESKEARILSFAEGKEKHQEQLRVKIAMLDDIAAKLIADIAGLKSNPSQTEYRALLKQTVERLSQVQNWINTGQQLLAGTPSMDQESVKDFMSLKLKPDEA